MKKFLAETTFYTVISEDEFNYTCKIEGTDQTILLPKSLPTLKTLDWSKEEKCTQTTLAEIVKNHPQQLMEVTFNKTVKDKEWTDLAKRLADTNYSAREISKQIKTVAKGQERVISGRHYNSYTEQGRLNFFDMDLEESRQVTLSGITQVILDGVKYTKK